MRNYTTYRSLRLVLGRFLVLTALQFGVFTAYAGNIQVSNVTLTSQDSSVGTTRIQFDLSWENSWRYSAASNINNWDAAWVFAKFRVGGQDYLSAPGASNSGTTVTVNSTAGLRPGMPVRVSSGTGAFTASAVVRAVVNDTQFEVSETPVTPLSAGAVVQASRIWEHVWLGNSGDITAGTGTAALYDAGLLNPAAAFDSTTNPALGLFIYRDAEGYGAVNITDIQLRWNYRTQGIGNDDVVEVRVLGVEVAYVAAGAFYVGDGATATVQGQFRDGANNVAFQILSEDSITLGGTLAGQLANNNTTGMLTVDDYNNTTNQGLSANFPKGYQAFYTMKYEVSQQQYVDFLNTLNRHQQNSRTGTNLEASLTSITNRYVMANSSSLAFRNGIRCNASVTAHQPIVFYCDLNGNGTGGEAADGRFIAANFLGWADLSAYLDWSSLRPMTELEFEKTARGQAVPVTGAYAWSNTTLVAANNITSAGQADETTNTTGANAIFGDNGNVQGPMRVGVFGRDSSIRTAAGAAFWGVMEMSGNVYERVVTTGQANGRAFSGSHGDGLLVRDSSDLSTYGAANALNWPPATAVGQGLRGGSWDEAASSLRTADRRQAVSSVATRDNKSGGRGVRSVDCTTPAGTAVITGATNLIGTNRATYSASGAGTAYWWVVPNGWEIISGQGTDTIELFADQSGSIRVAPFNACGSGIQSTLTITLSAE